MNGSLLLRKFLGNQRPGPVQWRQKSGLLGMAILTLFLAGAPLSAQSDPPATGTLQVRVLDGTTGSPTPVRVRITRNGRPIGRPPEQTIAVMYGLWDHADGYAFQPDSSFYVAGSFRLELPPGSYTITLAKGLEFLEQQHELTVAAGRTLSRTYTLKRWIHMARRGWYAADGHIHIRRSPRDNPLLLDWIRAEDVNVGVLLRMGDFWETYYPQYAYGKNGVYQQGDYLLTSGQEDPRTPELGHALGLAADDKVRFGRDYYYYDKVFDELHRRNGLTGYAHQAESFHGYRGLTLDGLRGKVDMLEILQFCVDRLPLRTEQYYRLLDLGFPLTAVAGSDFPWCGQDHDHGPVEHSARIGNARFYTYLDGPLTFDRWKAALKAGRTFVSSGPMLDFRVNNALPGDQLAVSRGKKLRLTATAYGHPAQVPLNALELVGHGKVLARVTPKDPGQSADRLTVSLELPVGEKGIWLAARCYGGPQQAAHTTPVYVSVEGGGFHNPESVQRYLDVSEGYLNELEKELDQQSSNPEIRAWYYKKGLKERIGEVRGIIGSLRAKLK